MLREPIRGVVDSTKASEQSKRVVAEKVWTGKPVRIGPPTGAESGEISRAGFEGALDKVSRPVKGKYADVPYSSEDLIRDKRAEVELEDR